MIEPYRMVIVNIFSVVLVLFVLLLYRFVYPKKSIRLLPLLLLLSLLPLISLLRKGTYESGDFNIHIYRTISLSESLGDGNFLPSWSKSLNAGYGYPLFLFLNILPYYLLLFFHWVGLSFIGSMKFYLFLSYIFSGIGMWWFAKKLFKVAFPAFITAVLYQFSPYHFVDLHFRAALGEITAFTILPFFLGTLFLFARKPTWFLIFLNGTIFGIFVTSHQPLAILSLIVGVPVVFYFNAKKIPLRTTIKNLSVILIVGLTLSSPVWIPHIIYAQFFRGSLHASVTFPQVRELFFSPWKYGLLFQGPSGQISFAIGYLHLFFVALALITLNKGTKERRGQMIFWLGCSLILFFLMTPLSSFFWSIIPLLNTIQFATRLLILLTFCLSLLAGYVAQTTSKNRMVILIFFAIILTILNWGHRRVIPEITDEALRKGVWVSTASGEGLARLSNLRWMDEHQPWKMQKPLTILEVQKGEATVETISQASELHLYKVTAQKDSVLRENTLYFPNWNVFVDNVKIKATYSEKNPKGLLTFSVSKGLHEVRVQFIDYKIESFSKLIAIIFSLMLLIISGKYAAVKVYKKIGMDRKHLSENNR